MALLKENSGKAPELPNGTRIRFERRDGAMAILCVEELTWALDGMHWDILSWEIADDDDSTR